MSITLHLPDDIGTEADVRRELAVALYREGRLPPSRAAALAGMDRWDFEALLLARKVPFPIAADELEKDILNGLRRR